MEHDDLRKLAEHPEFAEELSEVYALIAHLKECEECRQRYHSAIRGDHILTERIRKHWRHLSLLSLLRMKSAGFDRAANGYRTDDEWHLRVCLECQKRYEALRAWPWPLPHGWAIAALLLVLAGGGSMFWWSVRPEKAEEVYRSQERIALLRPSNHSEIEAFEAFEWRTPTSQITSCELFIFGSDDHKEVLKRVVFHNSYLLSIEDSKLLTAAKDYEWQVTCQAGRVEYRSPLGHFRFRTARQQVGYRELTAEKRDAYEDRAANSSASQLVVLLKEIDAKLKAGEQDHDSDRAWLLQFRADIAMRIEKYDDASRAYQDSAELWRKLGIPDDYNYARALVNGALAAEELGRLNQAFFGYKEAAERLRARREEPKYRARLATCLLNFGRLNRQMGRPGSARAAYAEALEIDRGFDDVGAVAEDLTNYANLLVDELNDAQQGLKLLREARELHQQWFQQHGRFRESLSATLDGLAWAERALGHPDRAREYFMDALRFDQMRGSQLDIVITLNNLADLLAEDLKDLNGAAKFLRRAIHLAETSTSANPDLHWRSYDGLGRVYLKQDKHAEAESLFLKSIRIIDSMDLDHGETHLQRTIRSERSSPFYGLAWLRHRQSNPEAMMTAIELHRATLRPQKKTEKTVGRRVPTLAELQGALNDGEILLSFCDGGSGSPLLLLAVAKTTASSYSLGGGNEVQRIANALRDTIRSAGSQEQADTALRRMAAELLPVEITTRIKSGQLNRLIVSLDGSLLGVPFDALVLDRGPAKYLINWTRISLVPSLTWWLNSRREKSAVHDRRADAVIIGDPVIRKTGRASAVQVRELEFAPLPASRSEARAVLSWANAGSLALLGPRCTSQSFRNLDLSSFKIVHFATHAIAGDSMESSFLLFGANGAIDVLNGSEVLNRPLDGQLVVLSACETGSGRPLSGQGSDSLAYAFLVSGASCVVSTKWRVFDKPTLPFMEAFYSELSTGATVDNALHSTKVKLALQGVPLQTWAAYEAVGKGEMLVPITPTWSAKSMRWVDTHTWIIVTAAGICILGALILTRRLRGPD